MTSIAKSARSASCWVNVALALVGPAIVAMLGAHASTLSSSIASHVLGVLAILAIVVAVYAIAVRYEGYSLARLGFGALSLWTPIIALAVAAFHVLIYGPFAY
jgi:hypothetical protein